MKELHSQTGKTIFFDKSYSQFDIPKIESTQQLGRSSKWLVDRLATVIPETIDRENAFIALLKEVVSQNEGGRGTHVINTMTEGMRLSNAHFKVARACDLAKRASNGLRLDVLIDHDGLESVFGHKLDRGLENEDLSDHNKWHLRRVEKTTLSVILNTGILQSKPARRWIDSTILFANRHDDDQLVSLQRNIENPELKLNAKKGHALAGAIMILCQVKRYAAERMVSMAEARRMCAGAAYMMMKHDEPERIGEYLSGRIDASNLSSQELIEHFTNNTLDFMTISPRQMIDMFISQRNAYPSHFKEGQWLGLDPDFEIEYKAELLALYNDSNKLLPDLSKKDKRALKLLSEVAIYGDVSDMVSPPYDSIYRTLLTQYSLKRPFMSQDNPSFRKYVNQELIHAKKSPLDEHATFEDYYVSLILYGRGNTPEEFTRPENNQDSDLRRLLTEFRILLAPSSSRLQESKYLYEKNTIDALMGMLAVRHVGEKLLRGDLSIIDESTRKSIYALSKKILKQRRLNDNDILKIEHQIRGKNIDLRTIPDAETLKEFTDKVFSFIDNPKEQERYLKSIAHIKEIAEDLKQKLHKKPLFIKQLDSLEDIAEQTNEQLTSTVSTFHRIVDRVLSYIIEQRRYDGIDNDVELYKITTDLQEPSWISPFKTFGSMAPVSEIRTIREPRKSRIGN